MARAEHPPDLTLNAARDEVRAQVLDLLSSDLTDDSMTLNDVREAVWEHAHMAADTHISNHSTAHLWEIADSISLREFQGLRAAYTDANGPVPSEEPQGCPFNGDAFPVAVVLIHHLIEDAADHAARFLDRLEADLPRYIEREVRLFTEGTA